eukprot:14172029-Alexandrium_andersonii.AAC.1
MPRSACLAQGHSESPAPEPLPPLQGRHRCSSPSPSGSRQRRGAAASLQSLAHPGARQTQPLPRSGAAQWVHGHAAP